jgi:ketosteroid isomerase-like protein
VTPRAVTSDYPAAAKRGDGEIELELVDMLASDERVALLVRERFHDEGPPVEIRRANVHRVRDGQIVEISIFEATSTWSTSSSTGSEPRAG